MSTTMDSEQQLTFIESTSTHDGENFTLGRRKRLRKKTSTHLSPKAKQQRESKAPEGHTGNKITTHNLLTVAKADQKPPNIYVRNVNNYKSLCSDLCKIVGELNFKCRSRFNDIAISTSNSDAYRATIKYLKSKEADFHCYQLPEEKSYRVVLRNLHYSTPTEDIAKELTERGYNVKRVLNVRHPITKAQLPLFFVDLEKTEKSREIFREKYLLYTRIAVEEPRRRNELMQCHKCQEYNHSQGYCNHNPKCVKCGEGHKSQDCPKPIQEPASCANCGGTHPANYKGCDVYKALKTLRAQRQRTSSRGPGPHQPPSHPATAPRNTSANLSQVQQPSRTSQSALRRSNVTYASLLSTSMKKVQAKANSMPSILQKPLTIPSRTNPLPLPTPNINNPIDSSSKPASQIPEISFPSKHQDPFSMMSTFLNKLETLLTPLISLMTSLITDLLPKLLK